jgi:hypothetical protein
VFRPAQLDPSEEAGYARVRRELDTYLRNHDGLVRFVSDFSASVRGVRYSSQGVEKLILDWPGFLERASALAGPLDAVEMFRKALRDFNHR